MTSAAPVTPFPPSSASQFQPLIPTSRIDCVPRTTGKLVQRGTVDAKAPSTASLRKASGVADRGLTYGEAAAAAWAVAKVKLEPSYGNEPEEMKLLVDGGHACGLSIDCSETVKTERATGSFTGDHTVYVHDWRHVAKGGDCRCEKHSAAKAHNEYLIEDPGNSAKGYQWWSAGLVYSAGEARTRDVHGISHGINLLVAPDTEGVAWKALTAAQIRSEPSYSRGRKVGRRVRGKTYAGGRTELGGDWHREDGTVANGWIHIDAGLEWGWTKARGMVQA